MADEQTPPQPEPPAACRSILGSRTARAIECALLFGVGPAVIDMRVLSGLLIPMLLCFAAVCITALLLDRSFDRRALWNWRGARRDLPRIAAVYILGGAAIALFTWLFVPDRLFGFVRAAPVFFAAVMTLYPVFSVYPQEIVFRSFFFRRYRSLFPNPPAMIIASGLAFGWAHIVLENWIAVVLSTIGGLLFAWTYHRTRSTLASSIEHALYGDLIWTIGLGWFFYAGSVGAGAG